MSDFLSRFWLHMHKSYLFGKMWLCVCACVYACVCVCVRFFHCTNCFAVKVEQVFVRFLLFAFCLSLQATCRLLAMKTPIAHAESSRLSVASNLFIYVAFVVGGIVAASAAIEIYRTFCSCHCRCSRHIRAPIRFQHQMCRGAAQKFQVRMLLAATVEFLKVYIFSRPHLCFFSSLSSLFASLFAAAANAFFSCLRTWHNYNFVILLFCFYCIEFSFFFYFSATKAIFVAKFSRNVHNVFFLCVCFPFTF